ncbi:MAG: hypothetical protein ABI665_20880 [Vicinamibacterales bacterium]
MLQRRIREVGIVDLGETPDEIRIDEMEVIGARGLERLGDGRDIEPSNGRMVDLFEEVEHWRSQVSLDLLGGLLRRIDTDLSKDSRDRRLERIQRSPS